ncbi:MAG: hypothetical protein JNK82_11885 [Myxococcaceae bacterium]|nr:hypothetical protein [Myxococcaceae bacterium]
MTRRAVVLVALCAASPALAEDQPLGSDKALHFTACTGIAAAAYAGSWLMGQPVEARLATGMGLALIAGVVKELYDVRGNGTPSMYDVAWDLAGAVTGTALAWLGDWLVTRWRESLAR